MKMKLGLLFMSLLALCTIIIWLGPDTKSKKKLERNEQLEAMDVGRYTTVDHEEYNVIVAGTDPEGVMAAIAAARNGMKVLLVEGRDRDRLGGLFTLGGLNTLDLNLSPIKPLLPFDLKVLNKGLFSEWLDQVEGTSFDTSSAAKVFYRMVKNEPNIELLMRAGELKPIVESKGQTRQVTGIEAVSPDGTVKRYHAPVVIDATQDADIAAAAGAPFMVGREDMGNKEARTAVTLVIKIQGITDDVWDSFGKRESSGRFGTTIWGFPEAADYVASDPERIRVRSLNIGRQADGTALINAMMIFGVDPLDSRSREEAYELGKQEAPRFIEYMRQSVPEFQPVEYAGVAEELYVRESRHIMGEYYLTIYDLMENRDHYDAIAYGSYQVDLHSTGSKDAGYILMKPIQYGVPFRALVPLQVDQLLVVGRSASYHSMAHGSARVVPLGMATGQAAGVAAAMSIRDGVTVRELSQTREAMAKLRGLLEEQGVDLEMHAVDTPSYLQHRAARGLLTAIDLLLATGGYNNEGFKLDGYSNTMRMLGYTPKLKRAFPDHFAGDPVLAVEGLGKEEMKELPLSLERAIHMLAATMGVDQRNWTVQHYVDQGWLSAETLEIIEDSSALKNGEVFLVVDDVLRRYAQYSEHYWENTHTSRLSVKEGADVA